MAQSTSGGRAFKDVINDPAFSRIGKKAKTRTCNIVEKILEVEGAALKSCIDKKDYKCVYEASTSMRRLIEFYTEGCK